MMGASKHSGNKLTPWSIFLLGKLTGFQLVKNFPAFYGTKRFITAFTSTVIPRLTSDPANEFFG